MCKRRRYHCLAGAHSADDGGDDEDPGTVLALAIHQLGYVGTLDAARS